MHIFKLQYLRIALNVIKSSLKSHNYKLSRYILPQVDQNFFKNGEPFQLLPMIMVASLALPQDNRKKNVGKIKKSLLDEADELFNVNKYAEAYEMLEVWKDCEDVEVLWRISRILYKLSQLENDMEKRRELVVKGYELLQLALALDDTNFAVHKWYSILLDAYAAYNGIKARLSELETVKKHMMRAIELNHKDATSLYLLGQWCYSIADMAWYERKIASVVFGTPPTSSYEEALTYFSRAEEVDPNFYSVNLLMLAKTYLKLQQHDKARHYLSRAVVYPVRTDEDVQAKKEAEELLKKIHH